jgi:hypothetical protein
MDLLQRLDPPQSIQQIQEWPKLTLMANAWRTVSRSYVTNPDAINIVREFQANLEKLQRTTQNLRVQAGSSQNPCIEVRSALSTARISLGQSILQETEIDTVNRLLASSFSFDLAKRSLSEFSRTLELRVEAERTLREFVVKLDDWIRGNDLQETQRNRFDKAFSNLMIKYPELSRTSFEDILDINPEFVRQFTNSLYRRPRLSFSSIDMAEKFIEDCEKTERTTNAYSLLGSYGELLNKEQHMYKAYGLLIYNFLEYIVFLPKDID